VAYRRDWLARIKKRSNEANRFGQEPQLIGVGNATG
jgi:hypothetical protein